MFESLPQSVMVSDPWAPSVHENLPEFRDRALDLLICALGPLSKIGDDLNIPKDQSGAVIAEIVCKYLEGVDVLQG